MVEKSPFLQRNFYINIFRHRLFAQFTEPVLEHSHPAPATLVFLHEGLGSIAQWRDFPSCLSTLTGLPCLVYERLGYGSSDALNEQRTVRYLHDEALISLPEILEQCNIHDAILIGHSDGGSIALIYAAVHGDKICGVITEAAHVFVEDVTINGILRAVKQYETTGLKNRLYQFHRACALVPFLEYRRISFSDYLPSSRYPGRRGQIWDKGTTRIYYKAGQWFS